MKHCKLCEKCHERMDHHCLFLLKCIAKKNHSAFVWFIGLVLFCMVLHTMSIILYCMTRYPDMTIGGWSSQLFYYEGWIFTMMLMNVASMVWGSNLLYFQMKIVSYGGTTVFRAGKDSVLMGNERLLNVLYFIMGREPFIDALSVTSYTNA